MCFHCSISHHACSFVLKAKATPAKSSRSKKTAEEEVEVEEEITPPKTKGKGVLGVLSGKLKCKQGDRSPGEEPSNKPPSHSSVRVIVPLPPRPLSDYVQLGTRLSQPPFTSPASPSFDSSMGPPFSTSPSVATDSIRCSYRIDQVLLRRTGASGTDRE